MKCCEHCGAEVCQSCGQAECLEGRKECLEGKVRRLEAKVRELENREPFRFPLPVAPMPYRRTPYFGDPNYPNQRGMDFRYTPNPMTVYCGDPINSVSTSEMMSDLLLK